MYKILVINSGSTSLKFEIFSSGLKSLKEGYIENIGEDGFARRSSKSEGGAKNHEEAFYEVIKAARSPEEILVIGHRVVHGGEEFKEPTLITKKALRRLKKYSHLAPLHNPPNILGIELCKKYFGDIPNVAVFDTAFHSTIPEKARVYGIPFSFTKKFKIKRYGFHGISHKYIALETAKRLKKPLSRLNLITCHLGGGASAAAIKNGQAVDTSMGFTPTEGLIMMTRCGNIDPIIPLYLAKKLDKDPSDIEEILNEESGVKGVSGVSDDMLDVLRAAKKGNKRAKLAIDIFNYQVKKYISAYYGILGSLDAIVFTGGIGQNPFFRREICKGLPFLKNVKVLYIPTDEELLIAREALQCYNKKYV